MKIEEQLNQWVKGNSIHNDERDECCPDFSCCGTPIADEATRKRFKQAWDNEEANTIDTMLMMFLGALLKHKKLDKKVNLIDSRSNLQ